MVVGVGFRISKQQIDFLNSKQWSVQNDMKFIFL